MASDVIPCSECLVPHHVWEMADGICEPCLDELRATWAMLDRALDNLGGGDY